MESKQTINITNSNVNITNSGDINNNGNKICSKCKINKTLTEFYKYKKSKDGKQNYCKSCCKLSNKKQRKDNPNYQKEWRKDNPDYDNEWQNEKYNNDPLFKLMHNYRCSLYRVFKNNKKQEKSINYLCCTIKFLKSWLEYQFDNNMTIENHGKYWETDHVTPLSSMKKYDESKIKLLCHWSNLQPLTIKENRSKGSKVDNELYLNQLIKAEKFIKLWNSIKGNEDYIGILPNIN